MGFAGVLVGMPDRDLVFVSYCQKDSKWLEEVQTTLRPLIREGELTLWDDTRIEGAQDWSDEITSALGRARLAILLVTRRFLASDFIHQIELPRFLEAARKEGTRVLPIFVSPTDAGDEITRFSAVRPNRPDNTLIDMVEAEQERFWAAFKRRVEVLLGEPLEPAEKTSEAGRAESIYDLLISHPESKGPLVADLEEACRAAGLNVVCEPWLSDPDDIWLEDLGDLFASNACRALAIVVDRSGYGPWGEGTPRELAERVRDRRDPLIALVPSGEDLPRGTSGLRISRFSKVDFAADRVERAAGDLARMILRERSEPSKTESTTADLGHVVRKLATKLVDGSVPFVLGCCWPDAENQRDQGSAPVASSPAAITAQLLRDGRLLGADDALPDLLPPLDVAGSYYAIRMKDEEPLGQALESIAKKVPQIPYCHLLLAEILKLSGKRSAVLAREHPQVVLTTCTDLRLERALLQKRLVFTRIIQYRKSHRLLGAPLQLLVQKVSPPHGTGTRFELEGDDGAPRIFDVGAPDHQVEPFARALDRYLEQSATETRHTVEKAPLLRDLEGLIVYKFHGSVDRHESCLISTDQYYRLFADVPRYIPEILTSTVINRPLVLLGASILHPDLRMTLKSLFRDQQKFAGSYVVRERPPAKSPDPHRALEAQVWEELKHESAGLGFQQVEASEVAFLEKLLKQLEAAPGELRVS